MSQFEVLIFLYQQYFFVNFNQILQPKCIRTFDSQNQHINIKAI